MVVFYGYDILKELNVKVCSFTSKCGSSSNGISEEVVCTFCLLYL